MNIVFTRMIAISLLDNRVEHQPSTMSHHNGQTVRAGDLQVGSEDSYSSSKIRSVTHVIYEKNSESTLKCDSDVYLYSHKVLFLINCATYRL